MKKTFLITGLFISSFGFSQITSTAVNKSNFESSGFGFKGVRVLTVENISTPSEENYYVFSKNAKGSDQDELYIQQFKKIKDQWTVTTERTIAESGIVTSVWDARKSFFDADKDGQADVLFVYSKHPKGNMDKQISIALILIYKNEIYTIENTAAADYDPMYDLYDFNPEDLPKPVLDKFEEYWLNLDKK